MTKAKVTPEGKLAGERIQRACQLVTNGPIDRRELARRTRIGYSTLGNYEHGTRKLQIREAQKIAEATGIPAPYILGLIDEDDMELLRLSRETRSALLKVAASVAHTSETVLPNSCVAPAADQFPAAPPQRPKRVGRY